MMLLLLVAGCSESAERPEAVDAQYAICEPEEFHETVVMSMLDYGIGTPDGGRFGGGTGFDVPVHGPVNLTIQASWAAGPLNQDRLGFFVSDGLHRTALVEGASPFTAEFRGLDISDPDGARVSIFPAADTLPVWANVVVDPISIEVDVFADPCGLA